MQIFFPQRKATQRQNSKSPRIFTKYQEILSPHRRRLGRVLLSWIPYLITEVDRITEVLKVRWDVIINVSTFSAADTKDINRDMTEAISKEDSLRTKLQAYGEVAIRQSTMDYRLLGYAKEAEDTASSPRIFPSEPPQYFKNITSDIAELFAISNALHVIQRGSRIDPPWKYSGRIIRDLEIALLSLGYTLDDVRKMCVMAKKNSRQQPGAFLGQRRITKYGRMR